jgi:hypothetical protein
MEHHMSEEESMNKDPTELVITEGALKKARAYSKAVCASSSIECYGYLLGLKNSQDMTVYNTILAMGQTASGGDAGVGSDAKLRSLEEISSMGYERIGFWHSHHSMGAWHSGVDDDNLKMLGNSITTRQKTIVPPIQLGTMVDGNSVIIKAVDREIKIWPGQNLEYTFSKVRSFPEICHGETKDRKYYVINDDKGTTLIRLGENYKITVNINNPPRLFVKNYVYSLVLSGRDTYAELSIKTRCNVCASHDFVKKKVSVKEVKCDHDIRFTEEDILREVKERVNSGTRSKRVDITGGSNLWFSL